MKDVFCEQKISRVLKVGKFPKFPRRTKRHTYTHTHKNTKHKKHLKPNEGTSDLVDAGQGEDR